MFGTPLTYWESGGGTPVRDKLNDEIVQYSKSLVCGLTVGLPLYLILSVLVYPCMKGLFVFLNSLIIGSSGEWTEDEQSDFVWKPFYLWFCRSSDFDGLTEIGGSLSS